MSEPKRVQIIRPHQSINEFIYENPNDSNTTNRTQHQEQLINQFLQRRDYYKIGFKNLSTVQSMSFVENWPILGGNTVTSFSSGFVGQSSMNSLRFILRQKKRQSIRCIIQPNKSLFST